MMLFGLAQGFGSGKSSQFPAHIAYDGAPFVMDIPRQLYRLGAQRVGALPDLFSFTRDNVRARFSAHGLLVDEDANVPRIVWDPIARRPLGLRIDPARVNLVPHGAAFANWGFSSADWIVTFGRPDLKGGSAAVLIENRGTGVFKAIFQNLDPGTIEPYSFFATVEFGTAQGASVGLYRSTAGSTGWYSLVNFAAGVAVQGSATLSTSATSTAEKLADVGPNGGAVWRFGGTVTPSVASDMRFLMYPTSTTQNTNTMFLHDAQVERGAFPTEIIAPSGGTGARTEEKATVPGAGIGYLSGGSTSPVPQGTILVDFVAPRAGVLRPVVDLANAAGSLRLVINAAGQLVAEARPAGALVYSQVLGQCTPGQRHRAAFGWKRFTGYRAVMDGAAVITTVGDGGSPVGVADLHLGRLRDGSAYFGGAIARVAVWPALLEDARLQALTL